MSTDGGISPDGSFRQMQAWDEAQVMRLVREPLLARLVERHAISKELVEKLFAWRHPGFLAHVGEAIPFLHSRGPAGTTDLLDAQEHYLRRVIEIVRAAQRRTGARKPSDRILESLTGEIQRAFPGYR